MPDWLRDKRILLSPRDPFLLDSFLDVQETAPDELFPERVFIVHVQDYWRGLLLREQHHVHVMGFIPDLSANTTLYNKKVFLQDLTIY